MNGEASHIAATHGARRQQVMAQWAQNHDGYDPIHILSHGSDGNVALGRDTLNTTSLDNASVAANLTVLGQSLKAEGDLLIYGCSVAATEQDQDFLTRLAAMTGADVAASDNATGAAALQGNWVLERNVGSIETDKVVTDTTAQSFNTLLASTPLRFYIYPAATETGTALADVYVVDSSTMAVLSNPFPSENYNAFNSGGFYRINNFDVGIDRISVVSWGQLKTNLEVLISGDNSGYGNWDNGLSYNYSIYVTNGYLSADESLAPDSTTSVPANSAIIGSGDALAGDTLGTVICLVNPNRDDFHVVFLAGINATDLSSDNFIIEADAAPPSFDDAPAVSNVTSTGFTLTASANEASIVHYMVVADGNPAPTVSEIQNNTYSGTVVSNGYKITGSANYDTGNISITGLSAATAYDVYVIAVDPTGNAPSAPIKLDVTTVSAPPAVPGTPALQASSDKGVSNSDNITNIAPPLLTLPTPLTVQPSFCSMM